MALVVDIELEDGQRQQNTQIPSIWTPILLCRYNRFQRHVVFLRNQHLP